MDIAENVICDLVEGNRAKLQAEFSGRKGDATRRALKLLGELEEALMERAEAAGMLSWASGFPEQVASPKLGRLGHVALRRADEPVGAVLAALREYIEPPARPTPPPVQPLRRVRP